MKRMWGILLLVLVLATGCSRVKSIPQDEVHMNGAAFLQTTATVHAGQTVKFIDDPGAATHILVTGLNGEYAPNNSAPDQLNTNNGMTINAGQEMDIKFPSAGTFQVTCKIHPSMQLTVTVTP
jgi:plastocyanin